MDDLFSLNQKVTIVTGGNGGIGKGVAQGFAAAGADIVIVARNPQKTEAAVKEISQAFGVRCTGILCDVSEESAVNEMAAKVNRDYGRIDILVNNAGINIRKMPEDYDASEWDVVMAGNLRSAFLCSKSVYPAMKLGGGGKIINIGSMTSIFGGAKLAPYSASKSGIVQLTRSLACAWAKYNIQVNAILPGFIDTDLTIQARKDIPGLNETVTARTPCGRWGQPHELQGAAIFLASRASEFVTGISLPVDGGFSINML
ncbi:MAG: glucose 1-dehydrogenase [Desulfobacterales bacterium]|nr:glucose 1-dehydrogenase [Desulfobacterales bacterium]